jgi:hypothetical protein
VITASVCASFLDEVLVGIHRPNHVYKLALYKPTATLSEHTTMYSAAHEVPDSGTYHSGGCVLDGYTVEGGCLHFEDHIFRKATITKPKGGLIYNSSVGDRAVAVLEFVEPVESVLGDFKVELPIPVLQIKAKR